MSLPIARRVENAFLSGLAEQLTTLGVTLNGYAGRSRDGAVAPYYVVQCAEQENTTDNSDVFKVEIRVVLVSSIDDSTSAEHDARLGALETAVKSLPRSAVDTEQGVQFFGFWLESQSTATEDQQFGDVLVIPAGAGKL
jgi:hypothetical protein